MTVETTFNKKLLRGVQGGGFLEKTPPGIIMFILLILILPMVLFSLSDWDQDVKELEEKLKTASIQEKTELLHNFMFKYMEIAPDKSLAYAREELRLAKQLNDPNRIFLALSGIGGCYYVKAQYREAIKYYLEALTLEPHVPDKNLIANALTHIGMLYGKLEDYHMAEKYQLKGLEIRKKVGANKVQMAYTLNNLGLALQGKKEFTNALRYYLEARELYGAANHKRGMVAVLNNIAAIYQYHYKDYSRALEHYRQTLPLYEEMGLQRGAANARQNIGKTYVAMHRYETARTYLETALELAKKIKSRHIIYSTYSGFIDLYKGSGDFKQALEYQKLHMELKDEIIGQEVSKQISRTQAKYDAETKDNEIRLLQSKNQVELLIRTFLVIAVILILGIGVVLYIGNRTKKKANHLLRTSEAKYRALFSWSGDAIFIADGPAFVDCNEKTLDLFGVTRDQVIGRSFTDFSPPHQPDKRNSLEAGIERVKKALDGEPQHFYWQHIKKDGTPIDTMISLTAVTVHRKKLLQAIVHDVSERKRLEEERVKAAKLETISLLANGITHDFNNLFTVFLWHLEEAKLEVQPGDKLFSYLLRIETAVNSAVALAKQFRAIAERGFHSKEILTIGSTLREAVDAVLEDANARNRCHFEIPEDLHLFEGDAQQIIQAIEHITRNALDAMGTDGEMQVTAANRELKADEVSPLPAGRYLVISVKDNGEGIPRENLAKIFDPYFTTRDNYPRKGLGMGLAIAQAIIKRHKGAITVSSQPGTGTIFHIYLPASN